MISRTRVLQALNHQEPDRIPFDLGGTGLSTIHVSAYQDLRRYLDMPQADGRIGFMAEQLVLVDEDVAERLQTDIRPVLPGTLSAFEFAFRDEGEYEAYTDEWGIGWRKPQADLNRRVAHSVPDSQLSQLSTAGNTGGSHG
jgi:uroporphyrinogen decarboxylase